MHNIEPRQDRWSGPAQIQPLERQLDKIVPPAPTNGFANRLALHELFAGAENRLPEVAECFWAKVDVDAEDNCWVWTRRLGSGGYGQSKFNLKGREVILVAHRFAYALAHPDQAIPDWVQVRHSCGEKLCMNARHLYLADRRGRPLSSVGNGLVRFEDRLP
jgi:hypothetical protein